MIFDCDGVLADTERMRRYFEVHGWLAQAADREAFVEEVHACKGNRFRLQKYLDG